MTNYYDPGNQQPFAVLDGMIVEKDALRVAEALAEYDPNLYVLCLENADDITEEPFIIAEKCKDGKLRPVIRAWKLDNSLLDRIRAADTQRFLTYEELLNFENKIKEESKRRYEEKRLETMDKVAHIAKIKSHYTVRDEQTGEIIHFYDDRPAKRTGG